MSTLRGRCICVQQSVDYIHLLRCQLHTKALMAKTSAISVRVADEVKNAAEKAAQDDGRSLANYVERLLREHLQQRGYLPSSAT